MQVVFFTFVAIVYECALYWFIRFCMKNINTERKVFIQYSGMSMELTPGFTYYLGGNSDLSVQLARNEGKVIGTNAQKLIISEYSDFLCEHPITLDIVSSDLVYVRFLGTDLAMQCVDHDMPLIFDTHHLADFSFRDVAILKAGLDAQYSSDLIWRDEDTLCLTSEFVKMSNVLTYFNRAHDIFLRFIPAIRSLSVFYVGSDFEKALVRYREASGDQVFEALKFLEKHIHVYAGRDTYSTSHLIDAIDKIPLYRKGSVVHIDAEQVSTDGYLCLPVYLSDSTFGYLMLSLKDDLSPLHIENIRSILEVIESELFSVISRDPTTRTRIGNYEKGITFIDEVNSTMVGRLAKSKAWVSYYDGYEGLSRQRELFVLGQRGMKFYRRIGDMCFYLSYASSHRTSKEWVSSEIVHGTVSLLQDSFRYLMYALSSEISTPGSCFALPLQFRASVARSDTTEESGRMRMDFIGGDADQDFIGEPLSILSTVEGFADPYSLMAHRWVMRDLASQVSGVLGGHASSGKWSYNVEHRVSLISILGLRRSDDARIIDSVLRLWIHGTDYEEGRLLPGMTHTTYLPGSRDCLGKIVEGGMIHFTVILPVELLGDVHDLEFRTPLLTFGEIHRARLLSVQNVYDLFGPNRERVVSGYRHVFSLPVDSLGAATFYNEAHAPFEHPLLGRIYSFLLQGYLIGSESEFEYFFNSLVLRDLAQPEHYELLPDIAFSNGETEKKDWDLIWEPPLRRRYEPILTNEFGVYF